MNYLAVRCWIGLWICLILLLTNCLSVSREYGMNYLAVRCWIGLWICLILLLMVAFDLSALVRYITRFTEESFATLIALIFIVEAFKKLLGINKHYPFNRDGGVPLDYTCECQAPTLGNGTGNESTAGKPTIYYCCISVYIKLLSNCCLFGKSRRPTLSS